LAAKPRLRRIAGRLQLDPRRDARNQPPERFEMADRATVSAGRLFDRHARFQRAVREVRQHRIRKPPQHVDPQRAIARRRSASLIHGCGAGHGRQHTAGSGRLEEMSTVHLSVLSHTRT
jgi:hypothetical protein